MIYQCRSCRKWFKAPTSGYLCVCGPFQECPCHCGDEKMTPVRYGDGTPYEKLKKDQEDASTQK